MTGTNKYLIQGKIKKSLKSGNPHYHSVLSNLFSRLLSKNTNITVILPFVLYGYEIWYLTLREEHRARGIEKRVLRRIFRPKRDKLSGICNNSGFHVGDYEEWRLLGCYAVWIL
jgi:hypothetical protein